MSETFTDRRFSVTRLRLSVIDLDAGTTAFRCRAHSPIGRPGIVVVPHASASVGKIGKDRLASANPRRHRAEAAERNPRSRHSVEKARTIAQRNAWVNGPRKTTARTETRGTISPMTSPARGAYRWEEEGIGGICGDKQRVFSPSCCFGRQFQAPEEPVWAAEATAANTVERAVRCWRYA